MKNQLSAFGTELQNKRTQYQKSQQLLLNDKQRLKKNQKKYISQKSKYDNEVAMIAELKVKNLDAKMLLGETQKEEKAMSQKYNVE